jgi:hypothetical protein
MPSIPLIVLSEESASSTEAVRESRRVMADLLAKKSGTHISPSASEDPALTRALAARDAFASEVTTAIAEHHRAGRDVVVEREGKLIRLPPPRT